MRINIKEKTTLMRSAQALIFKIVMAAAIPFAGFVAHTQIRILQSIQAYDLRIGALENRVLTLESELQVEKANSVHWDTLKRAELLLNNLASTGDMDKATALLVKQLSLEYQLAEDRIREQLKSDKKR
jgi:hypothetical protein